MGSDDSSPADDALLLLAAAADDQTQREKKTSRHDSHLGDVAIASGIYTVIKIPVRKWEMFERVNIVAIEWEINFTNFNAWKGCCDLFITM